MVEQANGNTEILTSVSSEPLSKAGKRLVETVTKEALRFRYVSPWKVEELANMGVLSKTPDLAETVRGEYTLRGINGEYSVFLRFVRVKDIWSLTAIDKRLPKGQVIDRIPVYAK